MFSVARSGPPTTRWSAFGCSFLGSSASDIGSLLVDCRGPRMIVSGVLFQGPGRATDWQQRRSPQPTGSALAAEPRFAFGVIVVNTPLHRLAYRFLIASAAVVIGGGGAGSTF